MIGFCKACREVNYLCTCKDMDLKEGWVLQLKDKSEGVQYFDGEDVTVDLNNALVITDKDKYIEFMKQHEENTFSEFGPDAICNAGYTNMMNNFEFVEVQFKNV